MTIQKIQSPLPGQFYRSPAPDAEAFKSEGASVSAGDTIGLIEVMKTFHHVRCDFDGVLVRFLVENEQIVEVDEVIAEVET